MYNHSDIESKWQRYWSEHDTFACVNPELENSHKTKFYALDMFPYPSGAGLHVGHPKGYTATDIIARYKHAKGFHVLHPMGWDAFGLPAENYAIKTGTHPAITTAENINRFRTQLQKFGFSFDWNREIDTTSPEYYKWSQWIFLKLFEAGLAYESDKPINFCPSCKTGLANEEVVDGKCERCGTAVEKKAIRQWVLAITKYADRLLSDIDRLDWPEGIKEQQRNWIGRSEGCQFFFRGIDCPDVEVFTTRIDTVFSAAFVVIAPDHPRVQEYIHSDYKKECDKYIKKTQEETDIERTNLDKQKTGVFTGSYVTNPFDGEKLPVWIGDFVLGSYGTGAVFGDAHDERDFVFAKKYGIPLKQSIASTIGTQNDGAILRNFVKGIIIKEGKILVLKYDEIEDLYDLPGGGIEDGENEYMALEREIKEETGYQNFATHESFKVFIHHYSVLKKRFGKGLGCFFRVELVDEKILDTAREEHEKMTMMWMTPDEIYEKFSRYESCQILANAVKKMLNPQAYIDDGILINSGEFDGLTSSEARKILTVKAEKEGFGKKVTNYKLRDWIFSRQRYWGEPIPLIHIKDEDYLQLPVIGEKEGIPYITLTGKSTPKNDINIKKFSPVNAIIRHWKNDQYVVLTFKNGERGLVGGSVEDGEEKEDAIIREVQEETGYKNVRVEKVIIEDIYSRGYKERKDLEEEARESIYVVKILNDEQISKGADEGIIKVEWVDGKDVASHITLNHHRFYWDYFYYGNFAYRVEKDNKEYLYISGKEFSQIYNGLSGKILVEKNLPLKLPEVEKYEPSGDGESPLATIPEWTNVRLGNNLTGKRETNTMPQWAGSCWYYLRFMDPTNSEAIVDPAVVKYWGEVDSYIGGAEHAVLHLLYARFWHKFLYDIKVVPTDEPFFRLRNVGLILGPDGEKMSKSKGNVINPDEVIEEYGADTLRLYEMSMADFADVSPWNTKAIVGSYRLLEKIYRLFTTDSTAPEYQSWTAKDDLNAIKTMHKSIKKVGEDIENMKFNTAIAAINIMVNEGIPSDPEHASEWKSVLVRLLQPFAPHMAEECWSLMGNEVSVYSTEWPEYISSMTIDDEVQIAVQINGKLRGTYSFMRGVTVEEVRMTVENKPEIAKWLEKQIVVKEIFIPNKILNIVIK